MRLDRLLQLLIIVEPAANLGNPFAPHAELPCASTRIAHRQNEDPVSFAARTFRAIFGMADGALQQRATQHLAGDRQFAEELLDALEGLDLESFIRMNQTTVAYVNSKSVRPCSFPHPSAILRAMPTSTRHFAPESS